MTSTTDASPIVDTFRHKIESLPPATYDLLKAAVGPELDAYVFSGVNPTSAYVERVLSQLAALEAGTSAAEDAHAASLTDETTVSEATTSESIDVPTSRLQARIDALPVECPALPPTLPLADYQRAEAWVASNEPGGDAFDQQLADAIDALAERVRNLPPAIADDAVAAIAVELGITFTLDDARVTPGLSGMTHGRFGHLSAIVAEAEHAAAVAGIPRAADLPPAREPNITPDPTHPPEDVKGVKAWVESSPMGAPAERAHMALRIEMGRARPRTTLVKWLEEFIDKNAHAPSPAAPADVLAQSGSDGLAGSSPPSTDQPSGQPDEPLEIPASTTPDHSPSGVDEDEGVAAAPPTAAAPPVTDDLIAVAADRLMEAGCALVEAANALRAAT